MLHKAFSQATIHHGYEEWVNNDIVLSVSCTKSYLIDNSTKQHPTTMKTYFHLMQSPYGK